jgi:hypothetical protein
VTVSEVFLGVIAVATLAMAVVQVGVLIAASRLARRVDRLVDQVEHELKPALVHLNTIGRDVSRAVALGSAQVERVDRLMGDLVMRLEDTVAALQAGLAAPLREGKALWTAFSAAFATVFDARRSSRRQRTEEEDALFI